LVSYEGRDRTQYEIVDRMQKYDFYGNRFVDLKPMHNARRNHSMILHRDCLYAIGGDSGNHFIEEFQPLRNQWISVDFNSETHFRSQGTCSAVAHEGVIYVCGEKGFQMLKAGEHTCLDLPPPPNQRAKAMVSSDGKILATGGCLKSSTVATAMVNEFDPRNRTWIRWPDMETTRKRHCEIVVNFQSLPDFSF